MWKCWENVQKEEIGSKKCWNKFFILGIVGGSNSSKGKLLLDIFYGFMVISSFYGFYVIFMCFYALVDLWRFLR